LSSGSLSRPSPDPRGRRWQTSLLSAGLVRAVQRVRSSSGRRDGSLVACRRPVLSATRPGCGSWPPMACAGPIPRDAGPMELATAMAEELEADREIPDIGAAGLGCLRASAERCVPWTFWAAGPRSGFRPRARYPGSPATRDMTLMMMMPAGTGNEPRSGRDAICLRRHRPRPSRRQRRCPANNRLTTDGSRL